MNVVSPAVPVSISAVPSPNSTAIGVVAARVKVVAVLVMLSTSANVTDSTRCSLVATPPAATAEREAVDGGQRGGDIGTVRQGGESARQAGGVEQHLGCCLVVRSTTAAARRALPSNSS